MKLLNSLIIDTINSKLAFSQQKSQNIVEKSFLAKNLDNIIFVLICSTLVFSLFLPSESIGIIAAVVIFLTFCKLLLLNGQNIILHSCNLFLLIYLGFNIVSAVNSELPVLSFYGLSKTLIYLGFYFSVIQYLRFNKGKIFAIIFLIAVLASFEGVIGIIQNNLGLENIATWQDTTCLNPEDIISRVYGTLLPYNPNLLGGYLICTFSAVWAVAFVFLVQKQFKRSLIFFVLTFITLLTLFFTGCRGAYIAIFIMFLLLFFASWYLIFKENNYGENIKKIWKSAVLWLVGCGTAILLFVPCILKRILSIFVLREDSSTSFRMNIYKSGMQMFQDHWILGIGTGNKVFREIYGLYMMSGFDALSCYCVFLEIAVESGIFALLAYLGFVYVLLKNAVTAFKNIKDLTFRVIILAVLISIIGVLAHGFVDTIYFRPQVQFVFWTMVAILVVLVSENEIKV